jgi:hypothetical protein
MRLIFALGFLLSSVSFAAENPLAKYVGCYDSESVSIDGAVFQGMGARVENGVGSVIKNVNDPVTHRLIPAVNFTFWRIDPKIEPGVGWPIGSSALSDRGTYTKDSAGEHFRYVGIVEGEVWTDGHPGNANLALQSALDVVAQADGRILVSFSYIAKNQDGSTYDRAQASSLLTKVECCDPSKSLCRYP